MNNGIKSQDEKNNEANAKAVQAASSAMAKTGNPYAAAIGKGIQTADKITGGKASQALGKKLNTANKLAGWKGKAAQKAINKFAENGTADRIKDATNKGKSPGGKAAPVGGGSEKPKQETNIQKSSEGEKQETDGNITINYKKDFMILIIGLKVFAFLFPFVIFIGLFTTSSQVFIKSIGLGNADSLSDSEVEEKINKKEDSDLDKEVDDNDLGNDEANKAISYNFYIEDESIRTIKLNETNLVAVAKTSYLKRKYQEADLDALDEFYPDLKNIETNENIGYDFYWKMYTLYTTYKSKYSTSDGKDLILDLPLLMATLYVETDDIEVVFRSNLSELDTARTVRKAKMDEFEYSKDWSKENYISNTKTSTHDMEILAQNMVTKDENDKYSVDIDKYRQFLKNFLYGKYVSEEGYKPYDTAAPDSEEVNLMIEQIFEMKEQYEFLAGDYEDKIDLVVPSSTNNSFWWPIGSSETTEGSNGKLYASGEPILTRISSHFGSAEAGIHDNGHGAIDIACPLEGPCPDVIYIIAAKSGVVSLTADGFNNNYGEAGLASQDGYGNYVKIEHSDGTYTLYGHMTKGSITVKPGEKVEQGQVIGIMGSSGRSTGLHLHFEVRLAPGNYDNRVDPEEYVSMDNPRPFASAGGSFSMYNTTLTKEEFVFKMNDYCERLKSTNSYTTQGFCNNFAKNAETIYDTSIRNNINPELVVVTAGAESGWAGCAYTNNFWGLYIPNGASCGDGPSYKTIADAIEGFVESVQDYGVGGKHENWINQRNEEREQAGCDSAGHGPAGTLEGWQSIYSWVGNYRYNPGSSGAGGCYVLNYVYNDFNYCDTHASCYAGPSNEGSCPAESATTVCEQNDYTAWQLKGKRDFRYDIFGL